MSAELDEQYLRWLYSQVASTRAVNPARTYWTLLGIMFHKEFIWLIPNDDNRVEDGRDLRHDFLHEMNVQGPHRDWLNFGCSVLEMLVALTRRLSFEDDREPRVWFWELLDNLGLSKYTDNRAGYEEEINDILDDLIWRTYHPSGQGGLFPLKRPRQDQRDVELWYQMHAYLLEREY